jgi:hypothetical protein
VPFGLAHNGAGNGRILASVVTFDRDSGIGALHESTDDGATFHVVGRVADPESAPEQASVAPPCSNCPDGSLRCRPASRLTFLTLRTPSPRWT